MNDKKLSTKPYKGVRDFYPEDMAVQNYLLAVWRKTALSFGFAEYDASILEPADLYRSKGAENAEMVDEQTYTFIDRGDREVTLRPEMTPTVARLIAGRQHDLKFPVRWFSIPNLFRYERPQRGRLREHWQFNVDLFGSDDFVADVEVIFFAYKTLLNFGATENQFKIKINHRAFIQEWLRTNFSITNPDDFATISNTLDRRLKISAEEFDALLSPFFSTTYTDFKQALDLDFSDFVASLDQNSETVINFKNIMAGLAEIGVNNVVFDASLARGFNYYTGIIFELVSTDGENNRALAGGGRYDNLTQLFSAEQVSGVGFGMGDVSLRDFLETADLLVSNMPSIAPDLVIIPTTPDLNLACSRLAESFRQRQIKTSVNLSAKKLNKKITDAADQKIPFAIVIGPDEVANNRFVLKNLTLKTTDEGNFDEISSLLINQIK